MSLSATHPKAQSHPVVANTIAMNRTTINNLCFILPELISGMCAGGGPARFSEPASPQTVPLFPLRLQGNLDRFPVFFVAVFRDADFDPVRRWPVAARMCHCATDSAIAHHTRSRRSRGPDEIRQCLKSDRPQSARRSDGVLRKLLNRFQILARFGSFFPLQPHLYKPADDQPK